MHETKLLRLQKSTNEIAWGIAVELGSTGPGLTSTSPEEQKRIRIRVRQMALIGVKGQYFHFLEKKRSRFQRDILSRKYARICI